MSPQNKFKIIVASFFGVFVIVIFVAVNMLGGKKNKNVEQVVKNNAVSTTTEKLDNINHNNINSSNNLDNPSNQISQNIQTPALPNLVNTNNSSEVFTNTNVNTLSNTSTNNITNHHQDNLNKLANTTNSTNNAVNISQSTQPNNNNQPNYNTNTSLVQQTSNQNEEIAKLNQRIKDLEDKINSQKQPIIKQVPVKKIVATKKQEKSLNNKDVLAVVGDRAWAKDSKGNEYNVAKGEKIHEGNQVKYIDNENDVIIRSSTH
jgi:hypothetical protein